MNDNNLYRTRERTTDKRTIVWVCSSMRGLGAYLAASGLTEQFSADWWLLAIGLLLIVSTLDVGGG